MQIMNNLMTPDSIGQVENNLNPPLKKDKTDDDDAFEAQMIQLGVFFQTPMVQIQNVSGVQLPASQAGEALQMVSSAFPQTQSQTQLQPQAQKAEESVLKTLQGKPEQSAMKEKMSVFPHTDAIFAGLEPSQKTKISTEAVKTALSNSRSFDQRGEVAQEGTFDNVQFPQVTGRESGVSLSHLKKVQGGEQRLNPQLDSLEQFGTQSVEMESSPSWGSSVAGSTDFINHNQPKAQKTLQKGLSGGEFLQALQTVKKGDGQLQTQTDSQSQFQSGEGNFFEQKLTQGQPKKTKSNSIEARDKMAMDRLSTPLHQELGTTSSVQPKIEVSAPVVPGAMSKPRLSTEALMGISNGIRSLTPQGGEMKIRFKPDHLGELTIRVMTHGNQVGLQIQASDDRAKRILEESMTHLKDSLSAQSLTLGQLDVTVAPQTQNSSGSDLGNSSNQSQNFSGFQGDFGQGSNHQQSWQGSGQWSENQSNSQWNPRASSTLASQRSWNGGSSSQNLTGNGRLDVRG